MKKILSFVLLLTLTISLASCHKIRTTVNFVVDGEVVESYTGSSKNIEFPTPDGKDGMEFSGWFTDPNGGDEINRDNVDEYLSFFSALTLYAQFVQPEGDPNPEGGDQQPTTPPDDGYVDDGGSGSNVDNGGWT